MDRYILFKCLKFQYYNLFFFQIDIEAQCNLNKTPVVFLFWELAEVIVTSCENLKVKVKNSQTLLKEIKGGYKFLTYPMVISVRQHYEDKWGDTCPWDMALLRPSSVVTVRVLYLLAADGLKKKWGVIWKWRQGVHYSILIRRVAFKGRKVIGEDGLKFLVSIG